MKKKKWPKQKTRIGFIRHVWRREINDRIKLSAQAHLVLVILLDHFNADTYRCNPGYDRIGKKSNLSRSSVRRALNELVEKQVVNREKLDYQTNQYRFPSLIAWMLLRNTK